MRHGCAPTGGPLLLYTLCARLAQAPGASIVLPGSDVSPPPRSHAGCEPDRRTGVGHPSAPLTEHSGGVVL